MKLPFPFRKLALAIVLLGIGSMYTFWITALIALRYIDPPTTGVQIQRRIGSWFQSKPYTKRYRFVPLKRISPALAHAAVSAEDGNFYSHHGIDWAAVQKVVEESSETGEIRRGGSTITQQLVKNLFFTTHANPLRKAFEYTLAPMADVILGKQRTLELYLNIVEWGPGVFGAEEAARYHFRTNAASLTREQSARLTACLPSPLRRRPQYMNRYSAAILQRMQQAGW